MQPPVKRRHLVFPFRGAQMTWRRPTVLLGTVMALATAACTRPPATPATDPQVPVGAEEAPTPPARTDEGAMPAGAIQHFARRGRVTVVGATQGPAFAVELALTARERQQGLMYRRSLAEDAGMLFDMDGDGDWRFYMRNTLLSLDMIFIDAQWQVVGVVPRVPPLTETTRSVGKPSRYVLELAAGIAEKHHITAGTRLQFERLADAPPPAGP